MRIFDVNILVYAFRPDLEHHVLCRSLLEAARASPAPLGISELVLSGFVRIVTSKRIFKKPDSTADALAFCESFLASPNANPVRPGLRHWTIFSEVSKQVDARDKLVADAYHAALAIEVGAEWVSTDRDYAKFPGLRWFNPLR